MLEELDEKGRELSWLQKECSKAHAGVMREWKAKEKLKSKMEEAFTSVHVSIRNKLDPIPEDMSKEVQ